MASTAAEKSKTGKSWTESRSEIALVRGRDGGWDCREERSLGGEKIVLFGGWIMYAFACDLDAETWLVFDGKADCDDLVLM